NCSPMPLCWSLVFGSTNAASGGNDVSNTIKPADVSVPTEPGQLRKFLERAQSGDASTLPALRKWLQDPAIVEACGNLATQAEQSLIQAVAGKDLAFAEGLTRKLQLLREELAGANPSPLERLLVERIVACWLQVQDADVRYAQGQKDRTFAQGEYQQRRMDHAHKRYLSAIKTLALVRKLALPVLQVNIAKKQVNVAGS